MAEKKESESAREGDERTREQPYSVEPSGNRAHLPSMHQRTKLSLFDVSGLRCFSFDIQERSCTRVCVCVFVLVLKSASTKNLKSAIILMCSGCQLK